MKYYNFEAKLNGASLDLPDFVASEIGPNRKVAVMLTLTDPTEEERVRDEQEADQQWAEYSAQRLFEEDDSSGGGTHRYDELLPR